MANIYPIIGDGNTRKSSIIRALTGAGRRGLYMIETYPASIEAFVYISSMQEDLILPEDLLRTTDEGRYSNILIPLWLRSRRATPRGSDQQILYPTAGDYLAILVNHGHMIMQPAILFQGTAPINNNFGILLPPTTPAPLIISDTITKANNDMSYSVKRIWNWM